jgi:hypothetical protein
MGKRGPKPQNSCVHGHDLTLPKAILLVRRKRKGRVYIERQCRLCANRRNRESRKRGKTR